MSDFKNSNVFFPILGLKRTKGIDFTGIRLTAMMPLGADPTDEPEDGQVRSLENMAALSYLGFLEEECAAYVTMTNIDSPVWNPVRERLLEALAQGGDSIEKILT